MAFAYVFPGQGSQKVGMGLELFESSKAAKSAFEQADEALGEHLSKLIFEGPENELTLTFNTQPAILTVSIAVLRAVQEKCNAAPTFVAGHSLGEFSALVAAGAMRFDDAIRTVRARGRFMQEAVPPGEGAMAAVIGSTEDQVREVCKAAAQGEVIAPANFNSPGQVAISGSRKAVERASAALVESGAKVIPLSVSAPFHSPLMEPAAARLDGVLKEIELSEPKIPIVTNVEAKPNGDVRRIRELLVRQVTAPVRWTESVQTMLGAGITTFVELGPGNVLSNLIRRIDGSAAVLSINSPAGLDKALATLEKL